MQPRGKSVDQQIPSSAASDKSAADRTDGASSRADCAREELSDICGFCATASSAARAVAATAARRWSFTAQKRSWIRTKKFAGSFGCRDGLWRRTSRRLPDRARARGRCATCRMAGASPTDSCRSPCGCRRASPGPRQRMRRPKDGTVNVAPRTRMPFRLNMSMRSECSSLRYSSCASTTRSHIAGLPGERLTPSLQRTDPRPVRSRCGGNQSPAAFRSRRPKTAARGAVDRRAAIRRERVAR